MPLSVELSFGPLGGIHFMTLVNYGSKFCLAAFRRQVVQGSNYSHKAHSAWCQLQKQKHTSEHSSNHDSMVPINLLYRYCC